MGKYPKHNTEQKIQVAGKKLYKWYNLCNTSNDEKQAPQSFHSLEQWNIWSIWQNVKIQQNLVVVLEAFIILFSLLFCVLQIFM